MLFLFGIPRLRQQLCNPGIVRTACEQVKKEFLLEIPEGLFGNAAHNPAVQWNPAEGYCPGILQEKKRLTSFPKGVYGN
jgi:hypothetical protein